MSAEQFQFTAKSHDIIDIYDGFMHRVTAQFNAADIGRLAKYIADNNGYANGLRAENRHLSATLDDYIVRLDCANEKIEQLYRQLNIDPKKVCP